MLKKLKGRSLAELRFRGRQELANLWMAGSPRTLRSAQTNQAKLLPDPEPVFQRIRGSGFETQVLSIADDLLSGRYQLLGYDLNLSSPLPWSRDPVHHREWPRRYMRRVPYLDFNRVGDHKVIWELNRHQHLVLLAQAWRISRRPEFLKEIQSQLESWWLANPLNHGINWTSALEVAMRALSWMWLDHFAGQDLRPDIRDRLVTGLYQHGLHLDYNLSTYFSPNTHLQGEAVALHALGVLYPGLPRARRWQSLGRSVLEKQLMKQVDADGAHFEKSTYYHVYALDFFLLHFVLAGRPSQDEATLIKMADYLHAVMGPARRLPFLGDDDGGRLFHPYGAHEEFGRATLATCADLFGRSEWIGDSEDLLPQAAWWIGETALAATPHFAAAPSRVFPAAGTAAFRRGRFWMLFDCGQFGPYAAGHSHSDTLSFVLRVDDVDVLIDPGTFTYMSDPAMRDYFRGSSAHNTIRVDGLDQARPVNPFAWAGRPEVQIVAAETQAGTDRITGEWRANGVCHRRSIELDDQKLVIRDQVDLPPGEHLVEQFWHLGLPVSPSSYRVGNAAEINFQTTGSDIVCERGWRSPAYGLRLESPVLKVTRHGSGRLEFETVITPIS